MFLIFRYKTVLHILKFCVEHEICAFKGTSAFLHLFREKKVREGCVGVSEMYEKGKKGKRSEKEPKDREPLMMVLVGINFRANYPNLEDLRL